MESECMMQVSLLIGKDIFHDLILELPDEFFGLSGDQKSEAWRFMLRQVNAGVQDPVVLSRRVKGMIEGLSIPVSV